MEFLETKEQDESLKSKGKYDFTLDMDSENALSVIAKRVSPSSRVLEFGPAAGRLTKYLKEQLQCSIVAVEFDKAAAQEAKKYCDKIIVDDIESFTWFNDVKNLKFDYIIFADVLEHLRSPEVVLDKASSLLGDDGEIILSIPNITHSSILIDLLHDKFTYTKTGLLDETHYRFFTHTELIRLFESLNLFPSFFHHISVPTICTEKNNSVYNLSKSLFEILQSREFSNTYQFVFALSKNSEKEIKMDYKPTFSSKLYYDVGDGYSEAQTIISNTKFADDAETIFDLSAVNAKKIKRIRWDPVDGIFIKLNVSQIIVEDSCGLLKDVKLSRISTNGIKNIFLTDDPMLEIKSVPSDLQKVTITYSMAMVGEREITEVVASLTTKMKALWRLPQKLLGYK